MTRKSFLTTHMNAGAAVTHPHLDVVDRRTLTTDIAAAHQGLDGLGSYRDYLSAARAAKAQRKGSTPSFERAVVVQAEQALRDAQTLGGSVLRIVQQLNQGSFWTGTFDRLKTTLQATGPVTGKDLWDEIWTNRVDASYRAKLQAHGLTDDLATAITSGVAQANRARVVLSEGRLAIVTGTVGATGATGARTVVLEPPGTPPANISGLLRTAAFDQVVAAFTNGAPVYIEPVRSAETVEPGHLFAAGAVVARQRMVEHVRKLQDTGLATVTGGDPVTAALVVVLASSLIIGAIGAAILYFECDQSVDPDRELCAVAEVLVILAMYMLAALLTITGLGPGAIVTIAWLSGGALLPFIVANFQFIMPTFEPLPAGSSP